MKEIELSTGDTIVGQVDTKDLTSGKEYRVRGLSEDGWFTIHDDQGEEHTFTTHNFSKFFTTKDKAVGSPLIERFAKAGVKKDNGKVPLGIVCQRQFPNALKMISEGSKAGHDKYKDTDLDWMNFKRVEGGKDRYLNALYRHLSEAGKDLDNIDKETNVKHISLAGWNLLALLETLEQND